MQSAASASLVITCSMVALLVIPNLQAVYADVHPELPTVTRLIFMMSPVGIVGISVVLGIGAFLGRFRPDYRRIGRWTTFLLTMFFASILLGLFVPLLELAE